MRNQTFQMYPGWKARWYRNAWEIIRTPGVWPHDPVFRLYRSAEREQIYRVMRHLYAVGDVLCPYCRGTAVANPVDLTVHCSTCQIYFRDLLDVAEEYEFIAGDGPMNTTITTSYGWYPVANGFYPDNAVNVLATVADNDWHGNGTGEYRPSRQAVEMLYHDAYRKRQISVLAWRPLPGPWRKEMRHM